MSKTAFAGAAALAIMSLSLAPTNAEPIIPQKVRLAAQSEAVVTPVQIARLKSELKLTAEQEPLWPAVERAFREIFREQFAEGSQGLVQRLGSRGAGIGLNAVALRRLVNAAYPLIRTLNSEQKQSALAFARSVGLETIAAAF